MSIEPITFDLNEVDTEFPVLDVQDVIAKITKLEIKDGKRPGTRNLVVSFSTVARATSLKGREAGQENDIAPGLVIIRYYPLQGNPEKPDYDFRKNLAELQDAALKTSIGNRPPFDPFDGQYEGKEVLLRVKPKKDDNSGQFIPGTDISRVKALAE